MSGADILKTLIELLEAQEQIKITYEIKERGDEHREALQQKPYKTWPTQN